MPRLPSLTPREAVKVYLEPPTLASLRLAAYSPLRGKTEHGEISRIVNKALELYFNSLKAPACTPLKPSPDSSSSDTSSNPAA